jgi:4-amino-4-deoxy-L-arabinose transferase-like glycosyltransferase
MKYTKHILAVLLLLLIAVPLRFVNLGYSEYQDDEKKSFYRPDPHQSPLNFYMSQRKGPLQFAVASIPTALTGNYMNEFAQRVPFALFNIASVLMLYWLLFKLTGSSLGSFFGAVLFATNGFVVGFGRISQYQSLNLFFSFTSLYFYMSLLHRDRKLIVRSMLGTLFFALSLFAHWDAIYYLPLVSYFVVIFLRRKDLSVNYKKHIVVANLLFGSLLILPLIIPYLVNLSQNNDNMAYFNKRVGVGGRDWGYHKYVFELYNPYITLYLYLVLALLSLLFVRNTYIYLVWFAINLLLIRFFMVKPGTHVYNYLIPLYFIFAEVLKNFSNRMSKYTRLLLGVLPVVCGSILYYQSYMLFVDNSKEYPWESKVLFGHATTPLNNTEIVTFGFPHFRDWKKVRAFIDAQNDECTYISNEGKEISQIYLGRVDSISSCYYVITVRRPFINTRDGANFAQVQGKKPLYTYYKNGEWMTRVYMVKKTIKKDLPQ